MDATVRGMAERIVIYTAVMEQTKHYNTDKTMQQTGVLLTNTTAWGLELQARRVQQEKT